MSKPKLKVPPLQKKTKESTRSTSFALSGTGTGFAFCGTAGFVLSGTALLALYCLVLRLACGTG
eukprot:2192998-Rhodomonas_salina.1